MRASGFGYLRETLAVYAATLDQGRAGRAWRNLQDTTQQPILFYRGTQSYPSWQRAKDYYSEGALLWLDVDTRIRELTRGQRSLDDFARGFFGVADGRVTPLTYTFEDVVAALAAVAPFDWAAASGRGWRAMGPARRSRAWAAGGGSSMATRRARRSPPSTRPRNRQFPVLDRPRARQVRHRRRVFWDSPAFAAGIAPRAVVIAVDGRAHTAKLLREAITAARTDPARRIALLVRRGDRYATVELDYHGGLRYPRLERIDGRADLLAEILSPRTPPVTRRPRPVSLRCARRSARPPNGTCSHGRPQDVVRACSRLWRCSTPAPRCRAVTRSP